MHKNYSVRKEMYSIQKKNIGFTLDNVHENTEPLVVGVRVYSYTKNCSNSTKMKKKI